jgi:glucose/arabinose dehydrogenase
MWRQARWLVLLLAACGRNTTDNAPPPSPPTPGALQAEVAFPNLAPFSSPLYITHAGDGTNRLFVVQQSGQILVFSNNAAIASATTFLDVTTLPQTQFASGGELGLLGLAFDPDYAMNGFFYVNYTINNTNANKKDFPWRTRIARFQVGTDSNRADAASEAVLLEFDQPFANHNGGMLAFGPDRKLYISTGDGGSGNDPQNNAQNLGVLLGKILRINPDPDPNNQIPADNPFVGQAGTRGEIWAYGLRNPFRMSFDRATGRLWAGDVGQSAREEVDIIARGGNYGWRVYEGTLFTNNDPAGVALNNLVAPVLDYDRNAGTTVIGGYVYHGPGLPDYGGVYIYADFGSGRIWALIYDTNANSVIGNTEVATLKVGISSFGEDEAGELYATGLFDGKIYRFHQM